MKRPRGTTPAEQFDRWVPDRPADGCWLWRGPLGARGYGLARVPALKAQRGAHRVAYELFVGPVLPGLCVLHRCDNPPCVNPAHLWLGTKAENNADRDAKRRFRRHDQPTRKLSPAAVAEIREKYVPGEGRVLAERFGVAQDTIYKVVHGHTHRRNGYSWIIGGWRSLRLPRPATKKGAA